MKIYKRKHDKKGINYLYTHTHPFLWSFHAEFIRFSVAVALYASISS
jgi:hypothetical protein